ncbi:sigma-54-dependent Fis family transcriptional regulator [Pseudodesulfovibrio sediminis]|uniref:Sigma-54-dependent Fis family transcriptional regulator n=1 Tax=Pseudodesulfovibrio sediminis TaxID=2810563 RepID=A0ABM7P2X4_9BACT|nr:sigma-54-dependent Fis family transcriptional regulator [Pseudodesulfovibrio sediminis]BCS87170.1 sigma-54-dependent Fis family transcriptional regulator [Pseudodesulfovibrio sediminis]
MDQLKSFSSTLEKICGDVETTAYRAIKGKKLLITMTNADARVVRTCGDLEVLRQADKLNFGPGANWAEESVGTNAIGTSLVTGRPIQVMGEEHFCRSHHRWSCTAAPILDPRGDIWGCFDISGPTESDHSKNMELVLQAAKALEHRLSRLYCSELEGQMGSLFSSMFNSVMTGIISMDSSGRITNANTIAETLLNHTGKSLRGYQADLFFDFEVFLAKAKHATIHEPVVIKCLVNKDLFVRAMPIFATDGTWTDTIITVSEMQRFHQSVVPERVLEEKKNVSVETPKGFEHVLHSSAVMRRAIKQAANVARTPSTVLLSGESGTGKELFARGIHQAGPRAKNPFVAVNCGAFSEELVQSELFGYCEGAFTGAVKRGRIGQFQRADKGVLFLDEISEMPLSQQVNLLRALEERAIVPVGGTDPRPVDVKIIAATNKDLSELVQQGLFREDLFYRLNVVGIAIPPLRDRGGDVVQLAAYHLNRLCSDFGLESVHISPEAESVLMVHDWPGNVRELVNCLEYAVNNLSGDVLHMENLPPSLLAQARGGTDTDRIKRTSEFHLKKREEVAIREALDFHNGNISKTAKALGIGRNTLYSKMERFSIQA